MSQKEYVMQTTTPLTVRIGAETIWEQIDVAVERGETVGLVGQNGAGKSVLLSCLSGATDPDSGSITRREPGAAYLPQNGLLPAGLSGTEAVSFLRQLDSRITDRWRSLATEFGIEDALTAPIESYSVGMRRKLELACVLSTTASVYILDEPTAGIDPSILPAVRDAIVSRTTADAAVVFATHRDGDLQRCDRLFSLSGQSLTETTDTAWGGQ
ncbi:ATP-binding cassette domain-containing protein [Natronocalculus amylovorans]|uniref:ABC transporter ATP-binding protein n=1 Tax=Natronocalculus amylovorans TaxID=2917812 RepID=A0AAE3K8R6_9EURY|nr:ABC transporter ATP-binding protein [Natronocalculus amylovorans]MCL9816790.1 ABC transporter ATP-binding protein [Natronocalculus amylovorans]NUE01230.1 ABC transporter ATP-binding protein [Halorubraceae archaeon YAN]